jgi:4-hydroxythreonine-4-phosphate dehydrogenase
VPGRRALIVADDLTGAADCAAQALRHGLSAAVALRPDTGVEADVLALDLDTRNGDARAAYAATRDAAGAGAPLLYVKLDSLLRGHVGAALDGALDGARAGTAVVAPAFPAQGRTTAGGRQLVDGEVVGDLLETLREQATREVIHVRDGELDRPGVLVCDAEDDDDLARIARAGPAGAVWAGSAGLAGALFRGLEPGGDAPRVAAVGGPALVVVGTQAAAAQLEVLLGRPGCAGIPAGPRMGEEARMALARGEDAVLYGEAAAGADLARAVEHAAGLVLTGGETARAVCDRVGVTAIELIREIEPGVPLGRAGDLGIVTKAGAFGGPATLSRAVDAIRSGA